MSMNPEKLRKHMDYIEQVAVESLFKITKSVYEVVKDNEDSLEKWNFIHKTIILFIDVFIQNYINVCNEAKISILEKYNNMYR